MQSDIFWMNKAIQLANNALDANEVPIGCIIVNNNRGVSSGYNQSILNQDPTAHAEIIAIRAACKLIGNYRLNKEYSIYVTLEPCIMCYSAIMQCRIGRLCFGSYNYQTRKILDIDKAIEDSVFNHKLKVISGICEKDTSMLLNNFFDKKRK